MFHVAHHEQAKVHEHVIHLVLVVLVFLLASVVKRVLAWFIVSGD